MLRINFLFCFIVIVQFSIAQHANFTIDLDKNQTINLRSMSHQDSLDVLIVNDTTLYVNAKKNNLFYIQNTHISYYLFLTENELDTTFVYVGDSLNVSGSNSHFIIFF